MGKVLFQLRVWALLVVTSGGSVVAAPLGDPDSIRIGDCAYYLSERHAPKTLSYFMHLAAKRIADARIQEPEPLHYDLVAESLIQRSGGTVPQAFMSVLPKGIKPLRVPSQQTEHPMVAMRLNPEFAYNVHAYFKWQGRPTSTTVYVSEPFLAQPSRALGEHLIGPEHPIALYHVHGGGTPTAQGGNASSVAGPMAKLGIPLMAIDQPGHGKGPRVPLATGLDWVKMNLQLIQRFYHPDVKVVISGHSWGGQFGVMFNLFRALGLLDSSDAAEMANLKRIVAVVALSPPADMSLGGHAEERLRLEREFMAEFEKVKHLVAPADWEFIEKMVRNGKVSLVAHWYTTMTTLSYSFLMLTEETRRKLLPMLTVIGSADFLYVGREQIFERFFSQFAAPSQFVVMQERETFKTRKANSGPVATGHQLFDGFLPGAGETREVFHHIADFLTLVTDIRLPQERPEADPDSPFTLLQKLRLVLLNNFAAREFFVSDIQFVQVPRPVIEEQVATRYDELHRYIDRYETLHRRLVSEGLKERGQAYKQYNQQHEVRGGVEAARKELALKVNAERRAELDRFLSEVERTEHEFNRWFTDEIFIREIDARLREHGLVDRKDLPQQEIGSSLEWADALVRYVEDLVQPYNRYYELDKSLGRMNQGPEGNSASMAEVQEEMAAFREAKEWTDAQIKKHRGKLMTFLNQIKSAISEHNRRYAQKLEKTLQSQITFPEGIRAKKDARWELSLVRSPEREEQLRAYLAGYDAVGVEFDRQHKAWASAELAKLPIPGGIQSYEQAVAEFQYLDSIRQGRLVAMGREGPPSRDLIAEMMLLDRQVSQLRDDLKKTEAALTAQRGRRTKLLRQMEILMENRISPALQAALDEVEERLAEFTAAYQAADVAIESYQVESLKAGSWNDRAMENVPDSITSLSQSFREAQIRYQQALEKVRSVEVEEGLRGHLDSPTVTGKKQMTLSAVYRDLLGGDYLERPVGERVPSADSVEGQIAALEKRRDLLTALISQRVADRHTAAATYNDLFKGDSGENLYFVSHRVAIAELLDRPFSELLALLNDREKGPVYLLALRQSLGDWNNLWAEVLREANFATSDLY